MRTWLAALTCFISTLAAAGPGPYDESADARADIRATIAAAAKAKVPALIVFGANWCPDCRVLDLAFKEGAAATLIASRFKVVKVDVGRFDRNTDVAAAYGVPLMLGIPAVAVLSPAGKVVYATKGGELADARRMGDTGIYDFFARVSAATR